MRQHWPSVGYAAVDKTDGVSHGRTSESDI